MAVTGTKGIACRLSRALRDALDHLAHDRPLPGGEVAAGVAAHTHPPP